MVKPGWFALSIADMPRGDSVTLGRPPASPGLAGCQVKAALFKRIGLPGIAGPKACAGRTEPSNNASPHHGAEKLSIARADYLLAEGVTIAAVLGLDQIIGG